MKYTKKQMIKMRTWHYKKYRVFVDDETIVRDYVAEHPKE